jgi:predicted component of type VI protein secretion system
MSIQITIQPPSSSADPIEAHYDADTISIGRSPDARVHLADVNRIVSKRHAEIRRTDAGYALVDLGSKNFTFLDGERLEANQPRALEDGDTFTIGDYDLTVHLHEPEEIPAWMESDSQETAFAADFQNPFEEPVSEVVEGLQQIAIAYEKMATTRRTDALQDALRGSDGNTERLVTSDGLRELFDMLGLSDALSPARSVADSDGAPASHDRSNENEADSGDENTATPGRQPASARPAVSPQPDPASHTSGRDDNFEPWTPKEASAQEPSAAEPGGDRDPGSDSDQPFIDPDALPNIPDVSYLDFGAGRAAAPPSDQEQRSADGSPGEASVEDMKQELVRAVARLITIPWQFRHEFIGQTIMQSPDSAFLYGSPDSVYDDLLGDRISPAERARRIACLREAVDAVVKHQVAMLDGYKASVSSGGRELLDALDPNQVRERVQEENQLYQWIPMLSAPTALDRLAEQHLELRRGAWSVAEHRVFRPAFIKAYLARMTSSDSRSEQDARPAAPETS